jgi:hypothetical protein
MGRKLLRQISEIRPFPEGAWREPAQDYICRHVDTSYGIVVAVIRVALQSDIMIYPSSTMSTRKPRSKTRLAWRRPHEYRVPRRPGCRSAPAQLRSVADRLESTDRMTVRSYGSSGLLMFIFSSERSRLYMEVVSVRACPSSLRTCLMSTPFSSRCTAKECLSELQLAFF